MAAFIANLTEQEQLRLYDAIQEHLISLYRQTNEILPAELPDAPLSLPSLGPSINSRMQDGANQMMEEMVHNGIYGIVETPGTGSNMTYWRNDRYFFLRYNDRVYMVSTNRDLSEIYNVEQQ